ncbi:MAG TPA: GNAT family N-acetyltransferase [Bacteroidia bacterium]|nr:GNAT family N-acetyltransferase [Bacteroidia bacterium]
MKASEPKTKEDFEKYYKLRYETLRKPWNEPEGSEKDESDKDSIHAFIKNENGEVIAIGRLHFNNPQESQIRYMAVHPGYRGKNIGGEILKYLEQKAKEKGAEKIILQAREKAVNFYTRNKYEIKEKTFLLFDSIQHYLMEKTLK